MSDPANESAEPCKRLFFALSCPPAQRRAIGQWRSALALRSGRPVPAENFHLTLIFLGAISVSQIPAICAAAASVHSADGPLRVCLNRLEAWRRPGILCLTPAQDSRALRQLVYALEQALLPLGYGETVREFRPHLTLMRDYREPVPEASTPAEIHLHAEHFALFESHKGHYRVLAEWPIVASRRTST